MRYMATIYASDVMDQVAVTIEVQGWESQFGPPEVVYQTTLVRQGVGEADALNWLWDVALMMSRSCSEAADQRAGRRLHVGGSHTLSETGDKPQEPTR